MKSAAHLAQMVGGSIAGLQYFVAPPTRTANMSMAGSRQRPRWSMRQDTIYQLTDRLHNGHVARVSGKQIAATVS